MSWTRGARRKTEIHAEDGPRTGPPLSRVIARWKSTRKIPKTNVDRRGYFSRTSSMRPIGVFCFRE
jgi:hypothetical protein